MKKNFFMYLIVVAGVCVFTACNKDDDNQDAPLFGSDGALIVAAAEPTDVGAINATLNAFVAYNVPDEAVCWFLIDPDASSVEDLISSAHNKIAERTSDTEFSLTLTDLPYNMKFCYTAAVEINGKKYYADTAYFFTTHLTEGPVDMGLSVKWAATNVGANKPESNGGLYQWGGLTNVRVPEKAVAWNNCPYHSGKDSYKGWTKYIPSSMSSYWGGSGKPDNKLVLDLSDDIAHKKLGGKWRIPTYEEWEELFENCTTTWMTINDVPGRLFTSSKPGYTGNCIFLPAAGLLMSDEAGNVGIEGYYWTSTVNEDRPSMAYMAGVSNMFPTWGFWPRYYGESIRPVEGK